jgi:uncharacterized membrane protein
MVLEVVVITFDGAQAAERQLSDLRAARDYDWLGDTSVIEHDRDGRYSVKAKNPSVTDRRSGRSEAIGGLTGLFVGAIGRPLGLVAWSGGGAPSDGLIGASQERAFMPLVEEFEARLVPDASMLVLVGETPALDALVAGTESDSDAVMRRQLTSEQVEELMLTADGKV